MDNNKLRNFTNEILKNMPTDWLDLTTHRLDIYDEKLAKTQFIDGFESLYLENNFASSALLYLPTAYDYIRLGHPLSCILEWFIASLHDSKTENIISFSSKTAPILAILRKNLLENKNTLVLYSDELPFHLNAEILRGIYAYNLEFKKLENLNAIPSFNGSTVLISQEEDICKFNVNSNVDFHMNTHQILGSIILINGKENANYISEIQHVRRRETIAMTPANCLAALMYSLEKTPIKNEESKLKTNKAKVLDLINDVTGTHGKALVGSSGLSIQYAIMMGLINDAAENHKGKAIKFIVPPNCYGGTNDQARRVTACTKNVEVVDLPVDGDNDMVKSIDQVLSRIANEDAVPYIIAEIPTNPRVEVPDLKKLKEVLSKPRKTAAGSPAIDPVFILDQTFCPNVPFLGEGEILSTIRAISYASGSKFPSGGKCTAGYCVANKKAENLMKKIEFHLNLCDNEATTLQYEILASQLPSMNQRIADAYINTREFVDYIHVKLPNAKINFVSLELAKNGFTPSVFSLDLPTKGNTDAEREEYKRDLNLKLINLMITKIPNESKFCVSYGQLKGCYWTIPATSTQGTTKEGDKDYIVRASLSPKMDLELHKKVFSEFVESL
jgi:cystathionine beta-lyase/cystathionine gamma-synthase